MNEREQQVIEAADEVLKAWEDHIGTHSRDCWKRHVACFAALVKDVLSEE